MGLIELLTFNSIPNIDERNNKFYVDNRVITIPTGSYEIEDIESYLQNVMSDISISLKPNNNELRSEIKCSHQVNFIPEDSIGRLLGFTNRILQPNVIHKSDLPVAILKVNALRVECNITTGAYINEQRVHTIHEFFPTVPPGYKIVEVPSHVIYLPISVRAIHNLQLKIVDQDGELVNFRGEIITIRLHVKSN